MAESESSAAIPQRLASLELGHVLSIPAVKQVLLLVGIAASVALGFSMFVWGQGPDYRTLFNGLAPDAASEVAQALSAADIPHRVSGGGSVVQVEAAAMDQARLELASQGLPTALSPGLESLKENSGFGVSQFMESARYQHALETELSRTIRTLRSVEDARVHLAVPKQSNFVRTKARASASVLLTLHRGRTLDPGQSDAILRLVAGSIPNLPVSAVTIVDQHGSLLSKSAEGVMGAGQAQFEYTRNLERVYQQKVLDLLTPIVGPGRVRTEVMADLDFTELSQTRESYDPASAVVRSEATDERVQRGNTTDGGGIPGAISNQPPAAGGAAANAEGGERTDELMRDTSQTRNYELDKTVSVTRTPVGAIRRLSIAVLIDDSSTGAAATTAAAVAEGESAAEGNDLAVSAAALARYTDLIKDAVGFDENRGDTVSVMTAPFVQPEIPPEPEAIAIWKNPTVLSIGRQSLGVIVALLIAFGIGRPFLKNLLTASQPAPPRVVAATGEVLPAGAGPANVGAGTQAVVPATAGFSYDQKIAAARNITGHDPARVAEVLKKWVAVNE